ncbi:uncharacterized protein [Musca autumnalis]|uniref:uncharacterized protein n=1 Tax=Musca autumnalis TaxID=221902 RepID=UPI003CF45B85
MTSSDFNKISSNCDVMMKIFELLDTNDQVRLASVNNVLRRIFLDVICSINYETLKIMQFPRLFHSNYIVSNNSCIDRIVVYGDKALEKFIKCWGEIVYELTTESPVPMCYFPNLIKLKCEFERVSAEDIAQIVVNLPNLKDLDISAYKCKKTGEEEVLITHEFGALTQLKHLTICNTEFSYSTRSITLPPNLTTLHLIECENLTFDVLQELLGENSQPQLTEFVSTDTSFDIREFKELKISSRIKTLNIKNFDLEQFRSPFVTNSTLEQLTLYKPFNWRDKGLHSIRLSCLTYCQQLHTLDVYGQYLSLDTLLYLTNLKKLSIYVSVPEQWSYITRILQELPSLRELEVRQNSNVRGPYPPLPPAVVTNVIDVKVKTPNFRTRWTYDFWFDMFSLNPQLELQMDIRIDGHKCLRDFVRSRKFPKDLRKIIIHGFTNDVDKVKYDSKSVYEFKIFYFADENEFEIDDQDEYNVILSRNIK